MKNNHKATILTGLLVASFFSSFLIVGMSQRVVGMNTSNQGEQRILVIPVYFQDLYPSTSVEEIEGLMVSTDSYLQEISYGKAWVTFTVLGWTQLAQLYEYYGVDATIGDDVAGEDTSDGQAMQTLIHEALLTVDQIVDYSCYDKILIYHAGYPEQSELGVMDESGDKLIETVRRRADILTNDFVLVESVMIAAEYASEEPSFGNIVHELCHEMGAVDLYDPDDWYNDINLWDVMAGGSWTNDSYNPSHPTSFTKLSIGYLNEDQVLPITNGSYTFELIAQSIDSEGFYAARYDTHDENDTYYLIESRKAVGHDSCIARSGILILRVDPNKDNQDGEVLLADDTRFRKSQRAYGVGEYFIIEDGGFGLQVLEETESGYIIEVSTQAHQRWNLLDSTQFHLAVPTNIDSTVFPNGTLIRAVELWNYTTDSYRILVSKSNDVGRTWQDLFGTDPSHSRVSPQVAYLEQPYNSGTYVPYLFCELNDQTNHSIEAWHIPSGNGDNVTGSDVDARNPSVAASDRYLYLAFEVHNITYQFWESPHENPIAIYSGSTFHSLSLRRYIENAYTPYLSREGGHGINAYDWHPYVVYTRGENATFKNEVRIESFYSSTMNYTIAQGDTDLDSPQMCIDNEGDVGIVSYERWLSSEQRYGSVIALNLSDSQDIVLDERHFTDEIYAPLTVAWNNDPLYGGCFYIGSLNQSVNFLRCKIDEDMNMTSTIYEPVNHAIIAEHLVSSSDALRCMNPLMFDIYGDEVMTFSYGFFDDAYYRFEPIYVASGLVSTQVSIPFILLFIILSSFIGILVIVKHEGITALQTSGMIHRKKFEFLGIGLLVIILVAVNYLFAFFFSAVLVSLMNMIIEGIFSIYLATQISGLLLPDESDGEQEQSLLHPTSE